MSFQTLCILCAKNTLRCLQVESYMSELGVKLSLQNELDAQNQIVEVFRIVYFHCFDM